MKYLSGLHALNVQMPDTDGDWHQMALDWDNLPMSESDDSPLGDWGIRRAMVPHNDSMFVASHPRACLDLALKGEFGNAYGMRRDFVNNESLTPEILAQAWHAWDAMGKPAQFDRFMGREYAMDWLREKRAHNDKQ